jgi:glycosyltransferase involved in cell wall biosynthesis
MRHVLYVNPTAIHGGAEEVLLYMMESVRSRNLAPVLVVPAEGWLSERCRAANIPVELLPGLPDAFIGDALQAHLRSWIPNGLAIAGIARRYAAVLVHANSPRASYHAGLGARLARLPTVTHVHDADPARLPYSSRLKAQLLGTLTDRLVAVSHAVAAMISSLAPALGARTTVVYNGWESARYAAVQRVDMRRELGLSAEALLIGSVAAMAPWKGQDLLIEAFAALHAAEPRVHLLIVGGSQGAAEQIAYEARLRQMVAERDLDNVVHFTGWREDVWGIMCDFDLFVHVPTLADPLPTAVIHASALGCLIVAARIGGIPEIVEDGVSGLLVPPGDAPALAVALRSTLYASAAFEPLREAARRRFAERFSRESMLDGLMGVYSCLIPGIPVYGGVG